MPMLQYANISLVMNDNVLEDDDYSQARENARLGN